MKVARLILGALSSLAAGAVTSLIAPSRTRLPWALGAIILAVFMPGQHPAVGEVSTVYHLVFLVTLVPLVALGGESQRLEQSEIVGIFGLQRAYQDLKPRKLA